MGKKIGISVQESIYFVLKQILGQTFYNIPYSTVYLEGTMGIGKSTLYRAVREVMSKLCLTDWGFVDCRLAAYSASDLQGVPYPVKNSKTGVMTLKWLKDDMIPNTHNTNLNNLVDFSVLKKNKGASQVNLSQDKNNTALKFGQELNNEENSTNVETTVDINSNDIFTAYYTMTLSMKSVLSNVKDPATLIYLINGLYMSSNAENDDISKQLATKCIEINNIINEFIVNNPDKQLSGDTLSKSNLIIDTIIALITPNLKYKPTKVEIKPGTPVLDSETYEVVGYFPTYGIILLDEVNQVEDRSVQSLEYQLILDHKINDLSLPSTWFVFCAGNRQEDGGVYERLKAPVRDRMSIVNVEPNVKESLEYFREKTFHAIAIAYVEYKDSLGVNVLHTYNAELENEGDEDCENYIFCTPRTIEFVSNALYRHEAMQKDVGNTELVQAFLNILDKVTTDRSLLIDVSSLMGDDIGLDFFNFYKKMSEFPIQKIANTKWVNDNPVEELPISNIRTDKQSLLINYAFNLQDIESKFNVITYLYKIRANNNLVSILTSTLSDMEKNMYRTYLTNAKCVNIISEYNRYNNTSIEYDLSGRD